MTTQRIINYTAFPILLTSAVFGLYWVWGLLFLWWVIPAIASGQAHFVFEVHQDEDPILFWAVIVLWAVLGAMTTAASLFPQYAAWLV